ncbi:single-stranded DNA-binding protein [Alicyclobacillus tolerans]|uniref:single-stranded DNA-binding protein n=1 Tax=Alicyclobacillus tolerans TaxID=90970 RepID=UPI003B7B55EE
MINRAVLIGRLTNDPELRYTSNGTPVATFILAVNRPRTKNDQQEADFLPIVVWSKMGESCAQYLHKGSTCAVDGRIQTRSYENRDGQKVRITEIVAENVRFLDPKGGNGRGTSPTTSTQPASNARPATSQRPSFEDDPFADDATIDISDEDLPF